MLQSPTTNARWLRLCCHLHALPENKVPTVLMRSHNAPADSAGMARCCNSFAMDFPSPK